MSRIGKKPIEIPQGVDVKINGTNVIVKGPKGELSKDFRPEISIEISDGKVVTSPKIETKQTPAFWGLTRTLLANMIKGVTEGFEKKLEINGVGYKASVDGNNLVLNIGYSHPVKIEKEEGINFAVEKNIITVSGIDVEKVSQIAAIVKKQKKVEPYKGKGIKYVGEFVRRKVGKKAAGAGK